MAYVMVLNGRDLPNSATDDEELTFAFGEGISFTDGRAYAPGDAVEWDFVSQGIGHTRAGVVQSTDDAGSITLANMPDDITESGPWDALKEWAFQKREAFLYDVPNRVWGDRVMVARGILEQPVASGGNLTFTLRDPRSVLDEPLQPVKLLGDNVAPDGVEGEANVKGQPKPVLYGLNSNIKPKLVNPEKLIYLACDKAAEILCVRDGNLKLTLGTIRANVASLQANAPDPGGWDYCTGTDGTYFRLGSPTVYELRFDAQEGATAADRTHAQVWKRTREERCGTDSGDIDGTSVSTVDAYDATIEAARAQERVDGDTFTNLLTSTPTPGNYLLAFAFKRNEAPVLEAGWTLLRARAQVGAEPYCALAYKLVEAGDTTSQTAFSGTGGPVDFLYAGSAMIEVSGLIDFASAVADVQFGASTTSGAMSVGLSSVTASDNAFAITFGGSANAVGAGAAIGQSGSGWSNVAQAHVSGGGNAEYVASQVVSTAGSTVTTTLTSTASDYGLVGALIVLSSTAVEVGFYEAGETTQRDFLDRVLGSLSGYEVQNLDGSWSIHRLDAPSGDPDLSVVQVREDIDFAMKATDRPLAGEPERARPAYAPDGAPPYRVNVNWGYCNDTMSAADTSGHPALARLREKFSKPWRTVTATDVTVWDPSDGSGAFPGAPELTINTGHQPGSDGLTCPKAQAEANRLLALYGGLPVRSQYVVPVVTQPGDSFLPGAKVNLTYGGDGLESGGLFVALQSRHRVNVEGATTTMILGLRQ